MNNLTTQNTQNKISRPGYEHLVTYMLGKVIQDLTVEFCDRWIDPKSRTHDQMVQAGRSNPQNIAEGYTSVSLKSYIFLTGIAHGSNEELAKDYQDFLRQRNLPIWSKEDPRAREFRALRVRWTSPTILNTPKLPADPTEAANMMLTLCNLEGFLLSRHVNSLKEKHQREGGLTENLYKRRKEFRGY